MADIDDLIDALVVAAQGVTAAMEQGCWSKSDDRELERARDALRAELEQARAELAAAREAIKIMRGAVGLSVKDPEEMYPPLRLQPPAGGE